MCYFHFDITHIYWNSSTQTSFFRQTWKIITTFNIFPLVISQFLQSLDKSFNYCFVTSHNNEHINETRFQYQNILLSQTIIGEKKKKPELQFNSIMNCKTVYFSNDENPPITSNKQYNFEKPLAINNERQANPNKTLNSRFRKKINWKQNIEINHENHAEIFVKKKFMPNEKNYQTRHDQVLKRTLTFCSSLFFLLL